MARKLQTKGCFNGKERKIITEPINKPETHKHKRKRRDSLVTRVSVYSNVWKVAVVHMIVSIFQTLAATSLSTIGLCENSIHLLVPHIVMVRPVMQKHFSFMIMTLRQVFILCRIFIMLWWHLLSYTLSHSSSVYVLLDFEAIKKESLTFYTKCFPFPFFFSVDVLAMYLFIIGKFVLFAFNIFDTLPKTLHVRR